MRAFWPLMFCVFSALACAAVAWILLYTPQAPGLTVAFLDVGQGDAIYVESPSGAQMLIDGGPDRAVVRELSRVMPLWDKTIDALVVTNPDQDHFAGFLPILERYEVQKVFESGTAKDSAAYATFQSLVREEGAVRALPKRGERIELGGGAWIDVLFPDRDVSKLDSNTGSLVMRLVYGDTSVLLMGDSVTGVEDFIVDLGSSAPQSRLKSQILKLGHHGSRTSTGEKLLAMVEPEVAIISAGCDNTYGHPHKEVLERLAAHRVPYLWTCDGAVTFFSDGRAWKRQ